MLELDSTSLVVVVVASGLAGLVKVAFGIGSGPFVMPVVALVLPPQVAVAIMAPVMFVTDISALHHFWRKWDTRHVLVLLPTCLVGIVIGTAFLSSAPPEPVRRAIGAIALLFVALQLRRFRRETGKPSLPMPAWAGSIIGLCGGTAAAMAHSGGIIFSIYLLNVGLAKNAFIASLVATFFVADLAKLGLYWHTGILTSQILFTGLALTPVMLAGGRFGLSLNQRVSVPQFTRIVTGIIAFNGLLLLALS